MHTQNRLAQCANKHRLALYGILVAICWTLLIAYSFVWDDLRHQEEALLLGKMQGQAFFEKDVLYRRWASRHGGVYVPVTDSTQPNPYLSHIPERDLTTPSGKKLTLVNPAYMTRQVFEMAQQYKGTGRGHITSLKPIRATNAPDAWERMALLKFEQGARELGQVEQIDGKPYYRYMQVLIAEKPCLKCHQSQGYKEGEVRGGLSVSVAMEPINLLMAEAMQGVLVSHLLIWLLGLALIGFGTSRLARMTRRLHRKNLDLENEIEERKAAQETLHEQALLLEEEIAQRQVSQEALQEQTVVLEEEIAERLQAEETVRVSEEKFAKAFDNAPIMMTISGLEDGVYLNVNKKFSEVSGFSLEEALGRTAVELGLMTAAQRLRLIEELHRHDRVSGVELQVASRSGKNLTCVFHGESIPVHGKRCLLLLSHDVTEHRVVEEQLRQSQKMEAIGQLAGGIAHDFNNILTVILGYSNILLLDSTLSPQQREKVEHVVSSSERASQLTRGLLTFSRKDSMELKPVDLNAIVRQLQKFLIRIIGEDVELKVDIAAAALTVLADAGHIEQVLVNLAANARDAMEKGGALEISIESVELGQGHDAAHGGAAGRYACITVSDTGQGMDEQTCQRVFEPFFTTKEAGRGTGLGMAIVYGIIKQHNGFIEVDSRPGLGTTFRIYLPRVGGDPGAQAPEPLGEVAVGGSETVLVAEDEANVRALLHTMLTGQGYRVILAENGQVAVELFRADPAAVDLVLLDVIMPGKNGQETLGEIRKCRPDIKAIYLSGYTADFMKSRGIDDQGVELLAKPFKSFELLRKVRDTLDAPAAA